LLAWIAAHREALFVRLRAHGALLFRGFDVRSARGFEDVARALDPELKKEYLGTSPRTGLTEYVFSASELPPYYPIPLHCEMSFTAHPPRRLFFCCLRAPAWGGETPLCDFRGVHAALDPAVRDRFVRGGLRIIRNYGGPGAGRIRNPWQLKPWPEMFGTTDRAAVEAKCTAEGFQPVWGEGGRLRLLSEQDAVRAHPDTGELAWFNHAQVFHLSTAPAEYRRLFARLREPWMLVMWQLSRALVAAQRRLRAPEEQTMHCTYRGGGEIPDADIEHLRDVIWDRQVAFAWREGDILAIDNAVVAHGRMPYRGPREVVVAWA
jgi:alpha-ketoglutarate-dependent taurine dioxygenase